MKLTNPQIRAKPSPKPASLSVKGVSDLITVRVDQYGIACYQLQLWVKSKRIQNRLNLFRKPKIILIAEEYDLA
jgi:hypothetical protein